MLYISDGVTFLSIFVLPPKSYWYYMVVNFLSDLISWLISSIWVEIIHRTPADLIRHRCVLVSMHVRCYRLILTKTNFIGGSQVLSTSWTFLLPTTPSLHLLHTPANPFAAYPHLPAHRSAKSVTDSMASMK
jgi:hypothetical protein